MSEVIDSYPEYSSYTEDDKNMLKSAYEVVDKNECWEKIKNFVPKAKEGFLWTNNKDMIEIMTKINNAYPYHSGSSLALVMRQISYISKEKRK